MVKRNWLEEAYKIHAGDKTVKVKREHVVASISSIMELAKKTQKLHQVAHMAYSEIRKTKEGLPPLPKDLTSALKTKR